MKIGALTLATTLIMSGALYAQTLNVQDGWQLVGATENVELSKLNGNCIDYIWQYDATNEDWKLHVANGQIYAYTGATVMGINAGEGFWVKGNGACDMDISNETGTDTTGFTLTMLENNTFYTATKAAGVGTEDPYTSIVTFHDDGTRSYSKDGGADSPANYEITVDGDLHIYNSFYDLKLEMISSYSSSNAIAGAYVYKMINGTYQLVGERAIFTTQADLDAFVASYFTQTDDLNVTTQTAGTLAFGSFSTAYGFEEDENDWYNAFTFATTSFSGIDYDYNGTAWINDGTFSGTVTRNSDQNISIFESTEGFGADIIFTQTEQITAIDGVSYTDLFVTDIAFHVTAVGTGWTDVWDWAPSYWDGTNQVNVTTNEGLLYSLMTQDSWVDGDTYAMFSGTLGASSGILVQGIVTGTWDGCTITPDNDCKKVERTTTQIGTWTFDTSGIHIDLPNELKTLTMTPDTASPTGYYVQSVGQDKIGSVWQEKWLTGSQATGEVVQQLLQ